MFGGVGRAKVEKPTVVEFQVVLCSTVSCKKTATHEVKTASLPFWALVDRQNKARLLVPVIGSLVF